MPASPTSSSPRSWPAARLSGSPTRSSSPSSPKLSSAGRTRPTAGAGPRGRWGVTGARCAAGPSSGPMSGAGWPPRPGRIERAAPSAAAAARSPGAVRMRRRRRGSPVLTPRRSRTFLRQLGVEGVADQPIGAGELAADGQGVAQESGNRAALERQARRHRHVLPAGFDLLPLGPGKCRIGASLRGLISPMVNNLSTG